MSRLGRRAARLREQVAEDLPDLYPALSDWGKVRLEDGSQVLVARVDPSRWPYPDHEPPEFVRFTLDRPGTRQLGPLLIDRREA